MCRPEKLPGRFCRNMIKPISDPFISIRHGLRPGDVGYITYLHGILYAPKQGWDHTFDYKI
jgi:hypothetical protein